MSTKTTFKRIALVAVAALGLGVLSVVPSSALPSAALAQEAGFRTGTFVSAPATATVGVEVKATFKLTGSCSLDGGFAYSDGTNDFYFDVTSSYTTQLDVAPVGTNLLTNSVDVVATVPTGFANTNATTQRYGSAAGNGYRNTIQGACTANSAPLTAYGSIAFTPDVAGTYVVVATPLGATTGAVTWTVTAAAKSPITAAASTLTPSATTLSGPKAIGSGAGYLTVLADNAEANASAAVTSATVSGPGLVSFTNSYAAAGRAISSSGNSKTLYFFADGTAGVSTITVYSGTTVLGTQTVTYYGDVASLTATVKKPVSNAAGVTTSAVLLVVAKDAAGVVVPSQNVTVTSGSTSKLNSTSGVTASGSQAALGTATIDLAGVADAFGTVALTIKDLATGLISTTASVTVSSPVAAAVTISFDKADYQPGEKATVTIKATDANGLPVANQLANASGPEFAWVANLQSTTSLPVEAAFSNGTMTFDMYAPGYTGAFNVSATLVDGSAWATAINKTVISATANISSDAINAATDAANEATDAANAATDAALAAADAADAATSAAQDASDAVAELSATVAKLMASLKAQLTSLTNLVIKIQKKVKA